MANPAIADRPRLTAAQWEQVHRLITELDQRRASPNTDECKRIAERKSVEFPVRLCIDNDRGVDDGGWAVARNISRGGLSILSRRMIHPGTIVTVELPTPTGPRRRIIARAIRCQYVSDLYHEIGISFVESAD